MTPKTKDKQKKGWEGKYDRLFKGTVLWREHKSFIQDLLTEEGDRMAKLTPFVLWDKKEQVWYGVTAKHMAREIKKLDKENK
jgi:hypothetical protein